MQFYFRMPVSETAHKANHHTNPKRIKTMNFNIVPDPDRPAFPMKHFNDPIFDLKIFNIADQLLKGYDGGYWEYVETDTAAFMMPAGDSDVTLINPFSGQEVEANTHLAGMIVTSYALIQQLEKKATGKLIDAHDKLNDAILDYCAEIGRMDVWSAIMD